MVTLLNGLTLPIESSSNCDSKDCVYILKCTKCNQFYIGQTNNFKRRFMEHLNGILNFEPYEDRRSNVALHFNLEEHDYTKHLQFFIYITNLELSERLKQEAFLINLFLKLEMGLLNEILPSIFSITNSSYA